MPNEYLYKTHADKGKEQWEIYAWAVRDAMSKASGFPKYEGSRRELLEYNKEIFAASKMTRDFLLKED